MAKQIALCDGGLNVWFLPYDPAIQSVIYRQIKAQRPGGEEEYEPLKLKFVALKDKAKPTKGELAKMEQLAEEISQIKARYGNTWLSSFVILDSCVVGVELLDDDNLDALAIDCYWEARDGSDPLGNFALFIQILHSDLIEELVGGYVATRAKLPLAPKETQGDSPPKDNPLGQNGSPANEGKHTKKRIESVS